MADWELFGGFDLAAQALETFLGLSADLVAEAVFDPDALQLPDGASTDNGLPDSGQAPLRRRRFLNVTERAVDVRDPEGRRRYSRLAYCSALATVWSTDRAAVFEAADYGYACYYLPPMYVAPFLTALDAGDVEVPNEWAR